MVGDRQIKDPTALKNPIVIVDLTDRIKYPNKHHFLLGFEKIEPAKWVHFQNTFFAGF